MTCFIILAFFYFTNGGFLDLIFVMFAPLSNLDDILKDINLISKYKKAYSNQLFKKILVEIGFGSSGLLQIWVATDVPIDQIHCQT